MKVKVTTKFKLGLLSIVILSFGSLSFAQSAIDTGQHEQGNNYVMGGISAGTGGALMAIFCPQHWHHVAAIMCDAIGPSLLMEGAKDILQGKGRSASINPLTNNNNNSETPCALDPSNPFCTHQDPNNPDPNTNPYNPNGDPNSTNNPYADNKGNNPISSPSGVQITPEVLKTLPPPVADALAAAMDTAKKYGLDINDPASVQAFKAKAAAALAQSGGGDMSSGGKLPPDVQAKIDKVKNDFLKKMGASTSDVALEGGGGGPGSRGNNSRGGEGMDFNSLLNGLKDKDRNPASIAGLQKNFNGNAIGIASDDIFKQVSRSYQRKINTQTFSP